MAAIQRGLKKVAEFNNCLVCGQALLHQRTAITAKCVYCGKEEQGFFICPAGHYVCNDCHRRPAVAAILSVCRQTGEKNPLAIAEEIMRQPSLKMHGPEHHVLIAAALLTAIKNATGQVTWPAVLEGIRRGMEVPGGYCAYFGACGAGIGVGIAGSVLWQATPLAAQERKQTGDLTAKVLQAIAAMGGVRCCKASVRMALQTAVQILHQEYGLQLPVDNVKQCDYRHRNNACNQASCPYYR